MSFKRTDRNQVRRIPSRGHYDRETIYEILDAAFLCHVGFLVDGQPFVIPTLYGRENEAVYLHGSAASRMLTRLAEGVPVCLTVTHVDGLVLARSAFHHSMNYRCAVLFGTAVEVSGDEKEHGLFVISEQVLKGRWKETRPPADKELKATSVLRVTIESASAKVRTGPPIDDKEDYALPHWAGVVPISQSFGTPEPDPALVDGMSTPQSLLQLAEDAEPPKADKLRFGFGNTSREPRHKEQVRRFYDVIWNAHDLSAIPSVLHQDASFRGSLGMEKKGRDGFTAYVNMVHKALGEYQCLIDELVEEADKVFAKLTFTGIHRSDFLGHSATQRRISWTGCALFSFRGDKICDVWVLGDVKSLESQLTDSAGSEHPQA